jgi:hypothetical protein
MVCFKQAIEQRSGFATASNRPALAPAPVPSGARIDREDQSLPPGGSETFSSTWASNGFHFARKLCEILGTKPAIKPSDLAPS